MGKGKYKQMKAWPTRRVHLFFLNAHNSLCGSVTSGQSFPVRSGLEWLDIPHLHEYDNLNFCQSCLRSAMAEHGEKYMPLSKVYEGMQRG